MGLTDEARCMNEIAAFVGPRDVAALDRASLAAAGLRLHAPDTRIVNYAAYRVSVQVAGEAGSEYLAYDQVLAGMWGVGRYRSLLMGEVPRLVDDEGGYGPRGAGYIAHVDVPASVSDAFERLHAAHPESVRVANPAFAGTGRR